MRSTRTFFASGRSKKKRAQCSATLAPRQKKLKRNAHRGWRKPMRATRLRSPEREGEKVEQLFRAFVEAKKTAGEDIARLTHAGFTEFVRKKTKDLQRQKNCTEVEYVVEVVENQVKLKALVKT